MKKLHQHLQRKIGWYAKRHQSESYSRNHYWILAAVVIPLLCGFLSYVSIVQAANISAGLRPAHNPFASLNFGQRLRGKRDVKGSDAIYALGTGISEVARGYKRTDREFTNLFLQDKTTRLDRNALVFYAEDLPQNTTLGDGIISNNPATSSIPDSQTFFLHSNPNATAKIYLDFKGGTVTTPVWNGGNPVVALPYSLDTDPGFSTSEMTQIKEIWRSVSEDYSPFYVDITTEKPTVIDQNHYMRVIATPTNQWFGSGAGGVAYVGSFRWVEPEESDTVAWVYSALLGNNTKLIEEAMSHEAGHTLGLSHVSAYDVSSTGCTTFNTTYYGGAGSTPGWSTIMGNSYNKPITQWVNTSEHVYLATPYGCNSEQDDVGVIMGTGSNGGDLRAAIDEAGNTVALSTNLQGAMSSTGLFVVDQLGVLSRGDIDVYRINNAGGTIQITVNPTVGTIADADFRVRLLNSNQTVLVDSNPTAIGSSVITFSGATAGTYYLEVTPSAYTGAQLGSGGYTVNGSLGRYNILGSYALATSDTTSPTVSISSPTNGAILSGATMLSATASDNLAVSRVDFYNGTTLLGTDTSSPYSLNWDVTSVANGTYNISAKAYDAVGNNAISTIISVTVNNMIADTTAPTVSISLPLNGTSISGTTILAANASDNIGVTKVEFYNDTTLLATATSAPYSITWTTTSVANGTYNISAKAYDAAGNTSTSAVISATINNAVVVVGDTTLPTVSITAPTNGKTVSGTVTLSATGSDNIGVTRVEFYNGSTLLGSDTSAPYSMSWDTKTVTNGSYSITAKAYDAAGNTKTSQAIGLTVNNIIPDTTAPTVGTILYTTQGNTITLTGTASDNIKVTKIELLIDGSVATKNTNLTTITYNWSIRKVRSGSHTIMVKAYDAKGNIGSNQISIIK